MHFPAVAAHPRDADFMVWRDEPFTYGWLRQAIERFTGALDAAGVAAGTVVSVDGDFSPNVAAAILALVERNCVIVPTSSGTAAEREQFRRIASADFVTDGETIHRLGNAPSSHPLYERLRDLSHPGLVIFTSGSTGTPKAALHDFKPLIDRFEEPRKRRRMIAFLLLDHIGGMTTFLRSVSAGGCLIAVDRRDPDVVCAAIERHKADVLPVTPSFLQLMLVSGAHLRHDLSSLEVISYGTEPISEAVLRRVSEALPNVRLLQMYGLSELGILSSRSKSSSSAWIALGGRGFETRVQDGMLEIRARSSILGYLNADTPLTDDEWFKTGDAVEVDGEYLRILGRTTEMINVGGQKLFPAEVEAVLEEMSGVEAAVVRGEPNAITGQMVVAEVNLATAESGPEFRRRMREFCAGRLAPYKIPQKVILASEPLSGPRLKKRRV